MKTDKEKLFESFEKVCGIKFTNNEIIEENWKNWAIGLGIVASSFFTEPANAQNISNIKNKVENIISNDVTLKKLNKEGYFPAIGDRINPNKSLIDSGIETVANTETASKTSLQSKLKSEGINYSNPNEGVIVYKKEGSNIRAKWIKYN
jgi:hypothetical protein